MDTEEFLASLELSPSASIACCADTGKTVYTTATKRVLLLLNYL